MHNNILVIRRPYSAVCEILIQHLKYIREDELWGDQQRRILIKQLTSLVFETFSEEGKNTKKGIIFQKSELEMLLNLSTVYIN